MYISKAENAEKNINHEFWRKMFCLVAITFASPKVSVTTSKQVLEEKRRVLWVSKLFQINLAFLDVRSVIVISIIYHWFFLFKFFSILLRGWLLVNFTRYMRYWDDLSVTQLLVRRMGHLKKDRLVE